MAEPLSSSDIWRIQRGFGVSELASPEERKRFADAGVAPLTTGARQRFEEGRGISPTSGATEKEAWVAAEVMAGKRDQMELPKDYGGLGERPEANTRRGFRMQQEWDKRYEMMIKEQESDKKDEVKAKEIERAERDQFLQENDFYYNRGLKEAEQKLKTQQRSEATSLITGLNNLDPRDPEYREKRGKLYSAYPLGATDQGVQKVAGEYESVNSVYQDSTNTSREKESEWLVGQQQDASALKVDTAPFFKTDPQTGEVTEVDRLGLSKAIGEAKYNDLESKKGDLAKSEMDKETKDQASSILDEINKTDSEIRKANFNAGREKNSTKRDEFIANSEFHRGERDVLVERFNALMPQKPSEGSAQPAQAELSRVDQSALDWANANPDDSRSQRIKEKLGVE
tara:strand:- start:952 stop:2148 length:1197 start_codon:yes stop_codon:yes gene_type:complete